MFTSSGAAYWFSTTRLVTHFWFEIVQFPHVIVILLYSNIVYSSVSVTQLCLGCNAEKSAE